ncbi:Transposase [Phytophthora megakarya]|uniref:Transposase n=1 Tax=Phytophthora megakarya TaxID=4795 RepID=A0A225VV90_9STRA|nr:Transposase [Phytophthora megakarya]
MPSPQDPVKVAKAYERAQAKARVVRAFRNGRDWKAVAESNDLNYHAVRRAVLPAKQDPKQRATPVKVTVKIMSTIEAYIDEDCYQKSQQLHGGLEFDLQVSVSKASVHGALQGMLYSTKKLQVEKLTMDSSVNKAKRKEYIDK